MTNVIDLELPWVVNPYEPTPHGPPASLVIDRGDGTFRFKFEHNNTRVSVESVGSVFRLLVDARDVVLTGEGLGECVRVTLVENVNRLITRSVFESALCTSALTPGPGVLNVE